MTSSESRLVLGTAQLGTRYGVANEGSSIGLDSARDLINAARSFGLATLETSTSYKASVGYLSQLDVSDFEVIAKVGRQTYGTGKLLGLKLDEEFRLLRRTLRREIATLLIHNAGLLIQEGGDTICAALLDLKAKGDVKEIGVSLYSPEEMERIPCLAQLDVLQAPLNLFDSRFVQDSVVEQFVANNLDLHVRSIFLQGLLLMSETQRPAYFGRWSATFKELEEFARDHDTSMLAVCLQFALNQAGAKKIIVGMDSADQLRELLEAPRSNLPRELTPYSGLDEELIDPRKWQV